MKDLILPPKKKFSRIVFFFKAKCEKTKRAHSLLWKDFPHSFSQRRDMTIERTKSNNLRLMKRTTFKNIGLNNYYEIKYYSRQHGEKHFVLKKRKSRATFLIGTILPRPSQN